MDSALTPREIQARIRAGSSIEDVAAAAGVEVSRVEPFAVPVVAEREFLAQQAQQHQVRRGGETISHHTLRSVIGDRLSARQIDPDTITWDAWKLEGRRWAVRVVYRAGTDEHDARFIYDQAGRFSVADNDDARWLLGLHPPTHPRPGGTGPAEAEPTVGLNDDLALVRVVQSGPDVPEDTEPLEGFSDSEDAFAEGELAEVDGVYDIVPSTHGSQLDVLYEMLAGFDEDSVQIYAGLVRSGDGPAAPVLDAGPEEVGSEDAGSAPAARPSRRGARSTTAGAGSGGPVSGAAAPGGPGAGDQLSPRQRPSRSRTAAPSTPGGAKSPAAGSGPTRQPGESDEIEQPSLVDGLADVEPRPEPKSKRKRSHVPSWDEIMFGSPGPRKP